MLSGLPYSLTFMMRTVMEHIDLCLISLGIASLIAFPLGILLARHKLVANISLTMLGMVYTIPGLALLAMLVPIFGLGKGSAIFALVVYAQFILLRNVVLGFQSVETSSLEAAKGLGLTRFQTFVLLEVPMAMPVWINGLRIATLTTLSTATTAAWINAGGLGTLIFDGISQNNPPKILAGAILISVLALVFDYLLKAVEQEALQLASGQKVSE